MFGLDDLRSMFGYATDEDRARWDQLEEASKARREKERSGLTAKAMASKSMGGPLSMAEKNIGAQMHAVRAEEHRNSGRRVERTTTIRESRNVDPDYGGTPDADYEPDF